MMLSSLTSEEIRSAILAEDIHKLMPVLIKEMPEAKVEDLIKAALKRL